MKGKHINQRQSIVLLVFFVMALLSCKEGKKKVDQDQTITKQEYLPEKNEVGIMVLEKGIFQKEIVSNGKLIALQKNQLKFDVSENIDKLLVKNGDYVREGQTLAVLKDFTYRQSYDKAKINLKKAELEFHDKLVGRGYETFNKDSIPSEEYEMLSIRSGYKDALHDLKNTEFNLKSTKLISPFSGKIANIKYKEHEQINAGADVMTLINDTVFEVEFYLIESEIFQIQLGGEVEVEPFASGKLVKGTITAINPQVEKDGTILVKGKINNRGALMDGMNVKVYIKKDISNQLVVPKSAVVLRQNQEVLFTVKSGRTYWTYVQTIHENSHEYSVIPHPDKSSASLKEGDSIIVSGNLNLAHDVEVLIKSTNR
ncbi:efflux RND transporter periplasmic adaptor subunit [Aestuariibaculum sediminum]|uniref:Efflux RND transporter periplasmic adaptor subunit n=1 Tax=Aestuariibaculum sediminum TaxID=2770637 RepID=A0A8J6U968_9FLAO|nr:efflux RND transporter periplasmic adaptor subunit [Aestuariibaculum sediminum]MBD0833715.1 efflux RND transporter periplasmic adaptor subunit [Aestuariibaculum sediminum]